MSKMKKKLHERRMRRLNVGGSAVPTVPAPAPSGAPGAATAPIQAYLTGSQPNAPTISYVPGEIAADQASRVEYQKNLRELGEAGITNPEQLVYRDWVTDEPQDRGWDDWSQAERDRYLTTGTPGHLISKDDRAAWQRGVHFGGAEGSPLTNQIFLDELAKRDAGGPKVPGVSTALLGGIGGAMRAKMREAVEAGGTPVATGQGQFAVINPDGSIIGNTGALSVHDLRQLAVDREIIEAPTGGPLAGLGKLFGSAADIISGKRAADKAAAEAAAKRARVDALQTAFARTESGGDDDQHARNEYILDTIEERTGSRGDAYSGSGPGGHFALNLGGSTMAYDDDIWGTDPLATPAEAVQLGKGPMVAPMAPPPQRKPDMLTNLATKAATTAATNFVLPGYAGGMGTGFFGLNAGGWVGKRTAYLVNGGMAQPQAEMQAYNEMQSLTGPMPVGPEAMMPENAPMPESFDNDFGYRSSHAMTFKEQMEEDKMHIQRGKAMQDEDRKERAFEMAEQRKAEDHKMKMQQKQESHAESMRQKKAGPLGSPS